MSGPGRLCRVLKIDKNFNGLSLYGDRLWIGDGVRVPFWQILKSPRIGIDYTLDIPADFISGGCIFHGKIQV